MNHVCSFSTGLSSALTVERVLARYGAADAHIVFMDTTIEDDDNYRFKDELAQRWQVTGADLVDLCEGRTPFQVAEDAQFIPNQKAAPCTFRLKIDPFIRWLETLDGPITIHIGFDYSEVHRCEATRRNYGELGYSVDFPLLWKPIEWRPYEQVSREDWGIEPPRMYRLGYSHANCGGMCVKQGKGDWIRTLINFPERYAMVEAWEQRMRDHPVRKNYAILRDQTGGVVSPMTLRELREQYERDNTAQLSLLDFDGGCVHCGVAL